MQSYCKTKLNKGNKQKTKNKKQKTPQKHLWYAPQLLTYWDATFRPLKNFNIKSHLVVLEKWWTMNFSKNKLLFGFNFIWT